MMPRTPMLRQRMRRCPCITTACSNLRESRMNRVARQLPPTPPFLQYFVCQATTGNNQGFTLFASSHLFSRYLRDKYPIDDLCKVRWTCHSGGYFDHHVPSLPLVVSHVVDARPCIRWHEPWPKTETKYGDASITIDIGDQALVSLVDSLLYDKRASLRFSWEEGDVMVNNNIEMLHTRTAFERGAARELWRIHVG
ncbi:hypothetical protein EDB82DRAFT_486333 [Fusarium venenatum]|uniref:uncharacterized protein n=1 Tax=Fusarium venenatum TaxID=56646 RepID=UPI001DA955BB|nr:hypothetical protein EDB82DRAFT_486333 [Fusarium venenatum]